MEEGYDQMSDVCLRAGWRGPEWMSLNPGIWEEWVHCLATPGVTLRMQRVKESERGCKRIQEELVSLGCWVFFFNDTATTEIYTLSLHDALPISQLLKTARLEPLFRNKRSYRSEKPVHHNEE